MFAIGGRSPNEGLATTIPLADRDPVAGEGVRVADLEQVEREAAVGPVEVDRGGAIGGQPARRVGTRGSSRARGRPVTPTPPPSGPTWLQLFGSLKLVPSPRAVQV